MPLYDYICSHCQKSFEEIRTFGNRDRGECRHCGEMSLTRKIPRFRIGKQGDLRETTEFHGCHSALADASDDHVHGAGCGHGTAKSEGVSE